MSTSLSPVARSARPRSVAAGPQTSVPLFSGLHALSQPIIASVRGHAIGVGAQMLLSADLVIASETLKLLIPQARLAHSVDHGESYFLPRKLGLARTMQLLLLAETLAAADAERMGLVNWVVPDADLESRTAEIVRRLAGVAPVAVAEIKSLVRQSLGNTLEQQFEAEMNSLATCAATEDFPEAINAFVEKRRPVFQRSLRTAAQAFVVITVARLRARSACNRAKVLSPIVTGSMSSASPFIIECSTVPQTTALRSGRQISK